MYHKTSYIALYALATLGARVSAEQGWANYVQT
jgi:hypothetical protein